MRILKKDLGNKNGTNAVVLVPEEQEDMWTLYNIIQVEDRVKAATFRRIHSESSSGTVSSEKVMVHLSVVVKKIEFDTDTCAIRVNGVVNEENPYVKQRSYHTIELELHRNIQITKDAWDSIQLALLKSAADPNTNAEAAAVILQEGFATICLIRESMIQTRKRIEVNIPKKKRADGGRRDKAHQKFYEAILAGIDQCLDLNALKCIILASPGFYRNELYEYLFAEAVRREISHLTANKPKFLLVHTSSGHKYALSEALSDPAVAAKLEGTKAMKERKALDAFYKKLYNEPDAAFYGYSDVSKAVQAGAVETLLVSDSLFRSRNLDLRKRHVELVDLAKKKGADVLVFSSLHATGEQLTLLTGVAALLRFPLPYLVEDESADADHTDALSSANLDQLLDSDDLDLFYLMNQSNINVTTQ